MSSTGLSTSVAPSGSASSSVLALALEQLLCDCPFPARVLVLGQSMPVFLDSRRIQALLYQPDASYDLPYEDQEWHAVLALESLEQIDSAHRLHLIRECFRVAKQGVVIGYRQASTANDQAEQLVKTLYQQRFHKPHPVFSHPLDRSTFAEISQYLHNHNLRFVKLCVNPLDAWLFNQLLEDHVENAQLRQERFQIWQKERSQPLPGYQQILVVAKAENIDLEVLPTTVTDTTDSDQIRSVCFTCLAHVLTAIETDWQQRVAQQQTQSTYAERQRLAFEQVLRQRPWHKLAHPRSLGLDELIPVQQLEPVPDRAHAWKATGGDPLFMIPCLLPPGWLRINIRMRRLDRQKPERELAQIQADYGDGFSPTKYLEQFTWNDTLADEVFLYSPKPIFALRFRPLETTGSFVIEEWTIDPISRPQALKMALERKMKLLKAYRCTTKVIARGLWYLMTGRFITFGKKLFKGLPDSRLMRPDNDCAAEAYVSWWRRRALTDMDRARYQAEIDALSSKPTIAVLCPVDNYSEATIRVVMESIRRQLYPNWELFVAMPGMASPSMRHLLERYAATDPRIHIIIGPTRGSIVEAGNAALEAIPHSHVAVLNPGYELAEVALLRLVQQLVQQPDAQLILNRAAPPKDSKEADLAETDTFRPGSGGQQLNLCRLDVMKASGPFPRPHRNAPPIGAEYGRRLMDTSNRRFLPDILTYPSTTIAPVQLTIAQDELANLPRIVVKPKLPPLLITGNILGISGWDYVVYELVRGLHSLGIDLKLNALSRYRADLMPPFLMNQIKIRQPGDQELLIAPPHLLQHHYPEPGFLYFTMWESNRIESKWVDQINRDCRMVIMPSAWGLESFRDSGVRVPLAKVPLGHNPLIFHPDGSWPDICTFGTAGALWGGGVRKNTRRIIELFQQAFPEEDDVRLRVKITPRCEMEEINDPRIEMLRCFMPPPDLAEWYRSLTAYVNGSYAEGFGLHVLEAMACGRPIVSSAYAAVGEYLTDQQGYIVDHHLTPTRSDFYPGQWGIPDDAGLVQAMRSIYENDQEARQRGVRAAARARQYTWKEAGRRFVNLLEATLQTDRRA